MTATTQSSLSLGQAVDQTRSARIMAVNAGDVDGSIQQFFPDGVFLPPGEPALKGPAAIRGWFTQVFGMFQVEGFSLLPGGVEQIGDLAIEHGSWSATFQPKNGSAARTDGGSYLSVYLQQPDGRALILRDTFNSPPV